LVAQGVRTVRILPLFLGVGRHAREDLPVLVAALRETYPVVQFALSKAVGEDERLVQLLAHIAVENLP
jgi:sirohydrochlorin cobaltochelatase